MKNRLISALIAGSILVVLSGCASQDEIGVPDTLPQLREYRTIIYPVDRLKYNEYQVIVDLSIDDQGNIRRIGLPTGTGIKSLDDSILTTVKQWKFTPAEVRGRAIPLQIMQQITIRFEPPLEYTLAEIVVSSISLADSIAAELEHGAEFELLARQHSIAQTAPAGGFLGEVELKNFRPDIYRVVRNLHRGGVSGPLPVDHVFAIYKRIN